MALRHVLFDLSLFPNEDERPSSQKRILALLQALTYCNQLYLQEHPETPLIYQSGIKYKVPEQFEKVDLPEVARMREYLKKKSAPEDIMDAFFTMSEQLGAGEHFRDIPRIIENGGGDCLPLDTLVMMSDGETKPIGELEVGDKIMDLNAVVEVTKIWPIKVKPTVTLFLSNGTKLVSSLDHRHICWNNADRPEGDSGFGIAHAERAANIKVGHELLMRPEHVIEENGFAHWLGKVTVKAIEHSAPRECVDITTSSGTFRLAQSSVITHNCDNVACWRAAELRELGINARPFITWRQRPDGGVTYHVVCLYPDGTHEDPSLLLGMNFASRTIDREEEERKLAERCANFLLRLGCFPKK